MRYVDRLIVFVDREVFLAQARDEPAAGIRYSRSDVDQLDTALEAEAGLVLLLRVECDHDDGEQRGDGENARLQIHDLVRLSTCGTMPLSLRKLTR